MQYDQSDLSFQREKKFRKHVFTIDSSFRNINAYPTPTYYRIDLPTVYKQVRKVRLLTAEIPASFYVFTSAQNNTTLHIGIYDVTNTTPLTVQTITIPDGNYTATLLSSTLKSLLDANALFISNGVTFTVSVNEATLCLQISNSAGRKIYVDTTYTGTIPNSSYPSFIGWGFEYYLGFLPNTTTISSSGSTPCISSRAIKLNPINYLLLDIPEINGMDEIQRSTKSVFAKIQNNVNSFDVIMMDENNCCSYNLSDLNPFIAKLSTLTISWRFANMLPIDFNDMDHSFTMEIECIE